MERHELDHRLVDTGTIASDAVTATEIAAGAVTATEITTSTITATETALDAVTTTEIRDGIISTADLNQNGASDGHVFKWNGTSWVPEFPGTSGSSTAFKLFAGGDEALRLEPDDFYPNLIVGPATNDVKDGSVGTTISGGGINLVADDYYTVGGGDSSVASGNNSAIPGGFSNGAGGRYSFATGAVAEVANDDAFVWNDGSYYHDFEGDSNTDGFTSAKAVASETVTGSDTFNISATGGVRFVTGSSSVTYIEGFTTGWSTSSSRSVKTDVESADPERVLDSVIDMEVAIWEYEGEDGEGTGRRHVGPITEDFHEAVDVGGSEEHINSVDARGVLFAAVQGVSAKLDEREEWIDDLEAENDALRQENADLRSENERLRERLDAVDDHLGRDERTASHVADD